MTKVRSISAPAVAIACLLAMSVPTAVAAARTWPAAEMGRAPAQARSMAQADPAPEPADPDGGEGGLPLSDRPEAGPTEVLGEPLEEPAAGAPVSEGARDVSGVVLAAMIAAAIVGLARGVRREALALAVIGSGYLLLDRFWTMVAAMTNKMWRIVRFAIIERGVLADDPSAAWSAVASTTPLLPSDGDARAWQIAFFIIGCLVLGYGGSRLLAGGPGAVRTVKDLPNLLERLMGGLLGATTGFLVSHFVLARVAPGARVSPLSADSVVYGRLAPHGPALFLVVVTVVILFGVTSIGNRGPQPKEYGR